MNKKVYCVIEEYFFDGTECNVSVFTTYEKAKSYFESKVEFEIQNSWIDEYCEFEKESNYFHAYDTNNYYETTIYIEEKEIQ